MGYGHGSRTIKQWFVLAIYVGWAAAKSRAVTVQTGASSAASQGRLLGAFVLLATALSWLRCGTVRSRSAASLQSLSIRLPAAWPQGAAGQLAAAASAA